MWGVGGGGGGGRGRRGLITAEILLAESCRKQVSFESGFKQRKGRRISEVRWQRPTLQFPGLVITKIILTEHGFLTLSSNLKLRWTSIASSLSSSSLSITVQKRESK